MMMEPVTKMAGDWITSEWGNAVKTSIENLPYHVGGSSYLVYKEGSTYYAKGLRSGLSDYSGSVASTVIQSAIDVLPSGGGKIQFATGKYVLTAPLVINKSSVHISGENTGGDLFFTMDATYAGISNKIATVLVADGIDGIQVGTTAFVFGICLENMAIIGKSAETGLADTDYSAGNGLNLQRVNTIQLRNLEILRKEKGIYIHQTASGYDYVLDILNMENIYFAYNVYGFYQDTWLANARMRNIWGYINQKSLLNVRPRYDWMIENVWSNADSWNTAVEGENPVYVETERDVIIRNVAIAGSKSGTRCPVSLIQIKALDSGGTTQGANVKLQNLTLTETQNEAVLIDGTGGLVEIDHLYAGVKSFYDTAVANPNINGCIVKNLTDTVEVKVNGGHVNAGQAKKNWFYGAITKGKNISIQNVKNYNPYGFADYSPRFSPACGGIVVYDAGDVTATPTASIDYTIYNLPVFIYSTGGTGVSITIKAPTDTVIASGLTTLNAQYLPVGYKINFGAFSVAPTVVLSGI